MIPIPPEMAKNALGSADDIREKVRLQKERMMRSAVEGQKYFIGPDKRIFIVKGWGWEEWISNTELYCGKRLFVKKGKKCSFHYHIKKDETFLIIYGKLYVLYSQQDDIEQACEIVLSPGDVFHVPPSLRHQFKGIEDTEFVEFSTQHFEEDSIRVVKGD